MGYKYTIPKTFNGPPCLWSLIGVLVAIVFKDSSYFGFFFHHLTSTCFFVRVRASTMDASDLTFRCLWTGPHLFLYLGGLSESWPQSPLELRFCYVMLSRSPAALMWPHLSYDDSCLFWGCSCETDPPPRSLTAGWTNLVSVSPFET